MLKILCVCGCGLGSSFAIEMTAKAVLKKLEIPAHIEHTTVSEAGAFKESANKQVISSQADSLIKISRIWADFFPANTSNQPI
ncbi:PTS sugar transporter subunit IIB, partial [Klebsiella pneumoniae]|uniref:PTS sugar transporter subunit IIB n=1 Tax=Klebsiella pneumoniae TaxID=573 RepID=UPI002FE041DC